MEPGTDGMRARHIVFPDLHSLVAISKKVQVTHNIREFKKDMKIQLSMDAFTENNADKMLETILLHWTENHELFVYTEEEIEANGNIVSTFVPGFSE